MTVLLMRSSPLKQPYIVVSDLRTIRGMPSLKNNKCYFFIVVIYFTFLSSVDSIYTVVLLLLSLARKLLFLNSSSCEKTRVFSNQIATKINKI